VGAALDLLPSRNVDFFITYGGQFSSRNEGHSMVASLTAHF
jgi:hypothetical protein